MYNDMKPLLKTLLRLLTVLSMRVIPSKIAASSTKHYIAPTAAFDLRKRMGFQELLDNNGLVLKFKMPGI